VTADNNAAHRASNARDDPVNSGRGVDRPAAIVLTPGAGAGRDQATLVALDTALTALDIAVLRLDFPYRIAGRRAPDRPAVLIDAVTTATTEFANELRVEQAKVALGGRSMGGRICSIAASQGLSCAALVLVSYPLHPPGRPERSRTAHFPDITVPCLFVSGDRDPFGSPGELAAATQLIPGPVTHAWLPGGDHSLRGRDAAVTAIVACWLGAN
jgi:hypothetical protein